MLIRDSKEKPQIVFRVAGPSPNYSNRLNYLLASPPFLVQKTLQHIDLPTLVNFSESYIMVRSHDAAHRTRKFQIQ
jgi:hypothetical protein